jgi:tRNA 2-thiouridine synthesizing protein A
MAERWDASDLGCGQLIIGLRTRLDRLGPGATIEVIARDAGAPVDLPAWCRMTGHTLVEADHPVYLIRRRD